MATSTSIEVRLALPDDAGRFVDRLSHADVGELVVTRGEEVVGGLYVECGRICWVAAKGRGRHLSDLLAVAAGVAPSALARHFDRCRDSKVPLGEDLVARGIVTADALRSALLLHSAECLQVLCGPDVSAHWQPRSRGYNSKFTFSTTELISRTHALRWPAVAAAADSVLRRHFRAEAGDWGAAFVRCRERGAPLSIAVIGAFPEKVLDLANDAEVSASALEALSKARATLLLAVEGDRTRCAFRQADCLFVGGVSAGGERRIVELRNDPDRMAAERNGAE